MPRIPLACSENGRECLYQVHPGDSLSKIVQQVYSGHGVPIGDVIPQILVDNPHITDPNLIYAGDLVMLRVPFVCADSDPVLLDQVKKSSEAWRELPLDDQMAAEALVPFLDVIGATTSGAKLSLDVFEKTVSSQRPLLEKIITAHNQYRNPQGTYRSDQMITKSQYDRTRRQLLDQFERNTGILRRPITGDRPAREVFRFQSGRSADPHAPFNAQLDRLKRITRYARGGGWLLRGVDIPLTCAQIAVTPDRVEQNRLLVNSAVGAGAGMAIGAGLAKAVVVFALVSNPIGWKVGLVLVIGSAVGGMAAGYGATKAYDAWGQEYDLVEVLKVDRVCTTDW